MGIVIRHQLRSPRTPPIWPADSCRLQTAPPATTILATSWAARPRSQPPCPARRSRPGHADADIRPGRRPHAAGGNARHSPHDDGRLREPIHLRPPEPTDCGGAIQHHRWQRRGRNGADFSYAADSQTAAIARYQDLAGTKVVAASTFSYDAAGRLQGLTHRQNTTTLAGYSWTYDTAHRVTTFADALHPAESATYAYDLASQLTAADRSGTTADETYTYDSSGNRAGLCHRLGQSPVERRHVHLPVRWRRQASPPLSRTRIRRPRWQTSSAR